MSTQNTKVIVSNVSAEATGQTISEFFSFCGKIKNLHLKDMESGTKTAILEFETPSATTTALLLNNAIIIDKPISVQAYTEEAVPTENNNSKDAFTEVPSDQLAQREHSAPDDERSKTSVIASLVGQGYQLGQNAIQKAQELDKEYELTNKVSEGYENLKQRTNEFDKNWGITEGVKRKINEYDQSYGISDRLTELRKSTTEKAKEIDDNYGLTEKTQGSVESFKQSFWNSFEKLKQDVTKLQQDYPRFAEFTQNISHTVEEVKQAIQQQNTSQNPSAQDPDTPQTQTSDLPQSSDAPQTSEDSSELSKPAADKPTNSREGPPLPPKETTQTQEDNQ